MKTVLITLIIGVIGYFTYIQFGNKILSSCFHKEEIKISDLKNRSSIFADSLIELKNLQVKESFSLLHFTIAVVSDRLGDTLTIICQRPYIKGEMLQSIFGRYMVIFSDGNTQLNLFICRDVRLHEVIQMIKSVSLVKSII